MLAEAAKLAESMQSSADARTDMCWGKMRSWERLHTSRWPSLSTYAAGQWREAADWIQFEYPGSGVADGEERTMLGPQ